MHSFALILVRSYGVRQALLRLYTGIQVHAHPFIRVRVRLIMSSESGLDHIC